MTAFSGLPAGWLDTNRLLINNSTQQGRATLTGCSIYDATGTLTQAPCALPTVVRQFQAVAADAIFVPDSNRILAVSTGSTLWTSADPQTSASLDFLDTAAMAGSNIIFVSGTSLLGQPHSDGGH